MQDTIRQMGTTPRILTLVLLMALTACGTGGETETPDAMEGPAARMEATDTTQVREMYDQIGRHYQEMMRRYEGSTDEMSPNARELYSRMRQHYQEMMPENGMGSGMMGRGNMARHMMAMHGRGEWKQEMIELHRQMAQVHAEGGYDDFSEMHEQMVDFYQRSMEDAPIEPTQ